jgi:hypothetical protein
VLKGDIMKVGKREIRLHLPTLKSGYSWQLNSPDTITVGDNTNQSGVSGYYAGCYKTFEECKINAIHILQHYISIVENLKEEDVTDLNLGRPNFIY